MSKTNNLFKIFAFVLVALLSFGLVACGESDADIAAKVDALIEELPADITLEDDLELVEAREAYDALTAEQKELVTKLADLEAKEAKFDNLKAADAVVTRIKGLPANLVLAHKALVTQARTEFDKLTADQKELVTNLSKLTEAEEKIAELETAEANRVAAKAVEDLIAALPGTGAVELEDEEAIMEAREAFDALTEDQQELVTNLSKLENAEAELEDAKEDAKRAEDQAAAQAVDTLISALPALVILSDKTAVEAARAAYEALTEDQKVFVVNLAHLQAKETRIANLELAKPVEDLIIALPEEVTVDDEDAIVAARVAYEALAQNIKELITQLDRLVQKEEELLIAKDPDLGAIYLVLKSMPKQIVNDYVLETNDGTITWAYKEGSDTSYYNIETGEVLKNAFEEVKATLVATKGDAVVEVEVNFGLLSEGQMPIFYNGGVKPATGNAWDGHGSYHAQLEKAGFGGALISVGEKVYFVSKDAYITLEGTEENEVIDRETLRPIGLSAQTDYNNVGLKNGVAVAYSGAGALYHNSGDVTITFNASDSYGRLNVPGLGFAKVIFKLNADGTYTVQPGLSESSSDGNAVGTVGTVMVTLEPGDMLWTPHSWEVDYVASGPSSGYGTKLHQNYDGVLAPDTVINVLPFKNLTPQDPDEIAIEILKSKIPANIMNDYELPTLEGLVWSLKEGEDDTLYDVATGELLRFPNESEKLVVIATYKEVEYEVELNFSIIDPTKTQFYYNSNDTFTAASGGTYATQVARAGFAGYTIFVGNKQFFLGEKAYIALEGEEEGQKLTREELRPLGLGSETQFFNNGLVTGGEVSINQRGYGVLYENTGDVAIKFNLSDTYGRNNAAFAGYAKIKFVPNEDGTYTVMAHEPDTGTNTTDTGTEITLNPGEMLWCPHTWDTKSGTYFVSPKPEGYEGGALAPDTIIEIVQFKMFEEAPVDPVE